MMARLHLLTLAGLIATALAGCKSDSKPGPATWGRESAPPPVALSPTDPCPERLHNLAGALLDWLVQYDRLPPSLEDLKPLKGTTLEISCPQAQQKYIYNPHGIKIAPNRWGIVYDASPSHSGTRWMIVFSPGKENQPPVPSVISVTESQFKAATEMPTFAK
jgi:hypothetical protein